MIGLFKHKCNRVAVRIAGASFLCGTVLMLAALMADNEFIVLFALIFFILYIPVTLVLFFVLFVNGLTHLKDIDEHLMTLIIVLMNFPIALLYSNFLNL